MVLYVMHEAGKPETWRWMGFAEPGEQLPAGKSESTIEDSRGHGKLSSDSTVNPTDEEVEIGSTIRVQSNMSESDESMDQDLHGEQAEFANPQSTDQQSLEVDSQVNPEAWPEFDLTQIKREEFWRQAFRKLNRQDRLQFYQFVRSAIETQQPPEASVREPIREIIRQLDRYRSAYHGKLLQLLINTAGEPVVNVGQTSWSELLLEMQRAWEYEIHPGLQSAIDGQFSEMQQLQAMSWLSQTLQRIAFDQIKDGTAEIRDIELPAWIELMENLSRQSADETAGEQRSLGLIDMTQLMGQTSFYRGKIVTIEGVLLRVQKIPATETIAGRHHFFELWIAPPHQSVFPYCVHALELPAEFASIGWEPINTRRGIRVHGYLFKRRFYAAEDGSPAEAPLILTRLPFVEPSFERDTSVDITSWSMAAWGSIVGSIAVVVSGFTLFVWRSARRRSRLSGRNDQAVAATLNALTQDPAVKSIEERLSEIRD